MENAHVLVVAMAEQCIAQIQSSKPTQVTLPQALLPPHLLWMCDKVVKNAEEWSTGKLNRWIGFVQCAMIANGILDLDQAKSMFDDVKNAYGNGNEDLADHVDPNSSFRIDIGGQG